MLKALAVYGYRSLRDLIVPLHSLNLVTGPNGSGKSNLYRALRLLAEIAQGRAILQLDHADEVVQRDGNARGARRCAGVALAGEVEGKTH
jgi:predicted ATPase